VGSCGVEIRPYAIQPDSENTECWQFFGSFDAYGYGRLYSGNKVVKAHRAFYEAFEGRCSRMASISSTTCPPPGAMHRPGLLQSGSSAAQQFAKAQ